MNASETLELNCPKCHRTVRVLSKSVGKRVRCPRCQAAFKIPGAVAAPADDDDWLNLERSDSVDASPRLEVPEDDEGLDPFMLKSEDLPPPPSSQPSRKPPPAKPPASDGFSDADMNALNSILKQPHGSGRDDSGRGGKAGDHPAELLHEEDVIPEFRVTCPICTSLTYVRTDQVGEQIKCPDCYSMITVPSPPSVRKAYKPDIENAETYAMVDSGDPAPFYGGPMAKSAAELLREAEEDPDDEPQGGRDYDNPDVGKWLAGIFGIFRDPSVILHLVTLSLLGALPGAAAALIGHPGFVFAAAGVTLLYFAFVLACSFSILESVANGEKEVSEWPYMDPGEWLGRMFMAVAAASLAGGPAALLGSFVFGPSLAMVALTMFSLYIFFPFVLLSMLESESILLPFSPEVSKSVSRCQESWGVLYLSAGLLFFGLLIFYVVVSLMPPLATVVLSTFATVGALFTYFSMIGQLAYAIGQAVNAPPRKNDIEKIRARERAERNAMSDDLPD